MNDLNTDDLSPPEKIAKFRKRGKKKKKPHIGCSCQKSIDFAKAVKAAIAAPKAPAGPKGAELVKHGHTGKLVSKKNKTGRTECSQAMSDWKRGHPTPQTFTTLAKCRAIAAGYRRAQGHREAGREAMAQSLEKRYSGQHVTAKDRMARAKELRAQRSGKQAAPTPKLSVQEQAAAHKKNDVYRQNASAEDISQAVALKRLDRQGSNRLRIQRGAARPGDYVRGTQTTYTGGNTWQHKRVEGRVVNRKNNVLTLETGNGKQTKLLAYDARPLEHGPGLTAREPRQTQARDQLAAELRAQRAAKPAATAAVPKLKGSTIEIIEANRRNKSDSPETRSARAKNIREEREAERWQAGAQQRIEAERPLKRKRMEKNVALAKEYLASGNTLANRNPRTSTTYTSPDHIVGTTQGGEIRVSQRGKTVALPAEDSRRLVKPARDARARLLRAQRAARPAPTQGTQAKQAKPALSSAATSAQDWRRARLDRLERLPGGNYVGVEAARQARAVELRANRAGHPLPSATSKPLRPLGSFGQGKSSRDLGRITAALTNNNMVVNGKRHTRKQLVDEAIREGAKLEVSKTGETRLTGPDGRYRTEKDLGKTAIDYARHVLGRNARAAELRAQRAARPAPTQSVTVEQAARNMDNPKPAPATGTRGPLPKSSKPMATPGRTDTAPKPYVKPKGKPKAVGRGTQERLDRAERIKQAKKKDVTTTARTERFQPGISGSDLAKGRTLYLSGNTFAHKDTIRQMGGRWNKDTKEWEVTPGTTMRERGTHSNLLHGMSRKGVRIEADRTVTTDTPKPRKGLRKRIDAILAGVQP